MAEPLKLTIKIEARGGTKKQRDAIGDKIEQLADEIAVLVRARGCEIDVRKVLLPKKVKAAKVS